MKSRIKESINESILALELLRNQLPEIHNIFNIVNDTFNDDGKLLLIGNGGSAADAQHIAAELIAMDLPAMALSTDTSVITATANDIGFENVFSRQIESLALFNDTVIAFSTSGNSQNIINGIHAAKGNGAMTIAFLGKDGGLAKGCADLSFIAPSDSTARIQEAHMLIWHILCDLLKYERE